MTRSCVPMVGGICLFVVLTLGSLGCDSASDESRDDRIQATQVRLAIQPEGRGTPVTYTYDLTTGVADTLEFFPDQRVLARMTLVNASASPEDQPTQAIKQDPDRFQFTFSAAGGAQERIRVDYEDTESTYNIQQAGDDLPVGLAFVLYISDDEEAAQGGLRIRLSRYENESKTRGLPSVDSELDFTWPVRIVFL